MESSATALFYVLNGSMISLVGSSAVLAQVYHSVFIYLFPIKLTFKYRTLQLGLFEFLEASDRTIVGQLDVFGEITSCFSASYL